MSFLLLVILSTALVEFYALRAVKRLFKSKRAVVIYMICSLMILAFLAFSILGIDRTVGQTHFSLMVLSFTLLYSLTKITIMAVLLAEDIYRGFLFLYTRIFTPKKEKVTFTPSRRKFVSQLALGIAAIPFFSILYGIFEGKYNFKVFKQGVFFKDLPESFDGLKVLQISDIHCGSFDNKSKIEYAVDLINEQDFDVLVFTGDLVNNFAWEMDDWIAIFNRIKTPRFGKFSILGNHDYGEYTIWKSESEKQKNFEAIKGLHEKIGFQLLLNENVFLEKDNEKIAIVGVENWGDITRFQKRGDLDKASQNLTSEDFKILLSHDPSHFEQKVKTHPKNFQLTLSGHTHGMQFGVEIPEVFKWSPIQYVYKYWAGLYQEMGKFLYVNRGFGFHAYSGRVGIFPEITVLELKKAQKN